jgi:hypothetical protein
MATSLTANGVTYSSGAQQANTRAIVKHRMSGCSTVNQGLPNGNWDYINGTEIDMGVPQKSTNWYRCEFYTDTDDWGGSNGGSGYALYRWTPSSGWDRILDSGWHANYDNNAGDFYTSVRTLFYAPVHQSYPTQQHVFRIYGRRHPDVAMRCNCSIGADLRQAGWENGMFEVMEMDGDIATTTTLSRY